MNHQGSFCLAILAVIVGISALTACFTIPEEREAGTDIEVTNREGMGGTGLDPDGIGGTGIIGSVVQNGIINVAGINIPSAGNAEIFLNGKASNSAALVSGRIAAVLIDKEQSVRKIYVFDRVVGSVPFMRLVSRLIVRGEVVGSATPDKVTVNGLTISKEALGDKTLGDIVRIDASAVPAGGFKINSVEKVSATIERPQSMESISKPQNPSAVENRPADMIRPNITTDRPLAPPTRPEPIEKPEVLERPILTEPVERPVLPDPPDRTVPDRPAPPVIVVPPTPVKPPTITPVLPSVDRPNLPRQLD